MPSSTATRLAPTEADLLQRDQDEMRWFADYMTQPVVDLSDTATFSAIVRTAIDKHGVDVDAMIDRFGINRTTVSRWKNGKNAPQPFARATVRDWIEEQVRARVRELGEVLAAA